MVPHPARPLHILKLILELILYTLFLSQWFGFFILSLTNFILNSHQVRQFSIKEKTCAIPSSLMWDVSLFVGGFGAALTLAH